jgi:hypothetical protein
MRQYHGAVDNTRGMTTLSTTASRCRRCQTGTQPCAVHHTNHRRNPKIKIVLTHRTAMRQYHGASENKRGMAEASNIARRCWRWETGTQACAPHRTLPQDAAEAHSLHFSLRATQTFCGHAEVLFNWKSSPAQNVSATDSSPHLASPKHSKLLAHTSPRAPTNPRPAAQNGELALQAPHRSGWTSSVTADYHSLHPGRQSKRCNLPPARQQCVEPISKLFLQEQ